MTNDTTGAFQDLLPYIHEDTIDNAVAAVEINHGSIIYSDFCTEITQGAEEFGMDLWEHVDNVIEAMRKVAPELGLAG